MKKLEKLTRRQESALKLSIKKWEQIVNGEMIDDGTDNCALCQEFLFDIVLCQRCPVAEEVGESNCRKTPYVTWLEVVAGTNPIFIEENIVADTPERVKAAKAQLDFLKRILKRRGRK